MGREKRKTYRNCLPALTNLPLVCGVLGGLITNGWEYKDERMREREQMRSTKLKNKYEKKRRKE